jgi:hypothetical protein
MKVFCDRFGETHPLEDKDHQKSTEERWISTSESAPLFGRIEPPGSGSNFIVDAGQSPTI